MPPQPSFSSFAATASKSAPSPWTGTLRLRAVRDVHRPHLRRLACEWAFYRTNDKNPVFIFGAL